MFSVFSCIWIVVVVLVRYVTARTIDAMSLPRLIHLMRRADHFPAVQYQVPEQTPRYRYQRNQKLQKVTVPTWDG